MISAFTFFQRNNGKLMYCYLAKQVKFFLFFFRIGNMLSSVSGLFSVSTGKGRIYLKHFSLIQKSVALAFRPPTKAYWYVPYFSKDEILLFQVLLDCGAVQADALTVDPLASLEKVGHQVYDETIGSREAVTYLISIHIRHFD